ncbi:MAG: hypothetical protein RL026_2420 [Pseudomonadota bacterium]
MTVLRRVLCSLSTCLLLATAAVAPASAAPTPAAFAPAQLEGFPQDRLVLLRGATRHEQRIWLADTPARQQQGLMFVTHLPSGYGMLFPLDPPREMTMWMKNTFIALDMVFIDKSGRITRIVADAVPQSLDIIASRGTVGAVLELPGGEARRLGLVAGDRVLHRHFGTTEP